MNQPIKKYKIMFMATQEQRDLIDNLVTKEGFRDRKAFLLACISGWAEYYKLMLEIERLRKAESIWTKCNDYQTLANLQPPLRKPVKLKYFYIPGKEYDGL